jgi:hypothetical protein
MGFSAGYASANTYQGIRYETTTGKVYEHMSGELSLAASTATWSTYTITLNGDGGVITADNVVTDVIAVSSAVFSNVAHFSAATSTITFNGQIDIGRTQVTAFGASPQTAACAAGYTLTGCSCGNLSDGTIFTCGPYILAPNTTCLAEGGVGDNVTAWAYCARMK